MNELKEIDEDRLYEDNVYRYIYCSDFVDFYEKDIQLIHESAKFLMGKVDVIVDKVFDKLFSFSCTKDVFFRERGKSDTNMIYDQDDQSTPYVGKRKSVLRSFVVKILTKPYDEKMVKLFDAMGQVHSLMSGKATVHVALIHMNLMLASLQDAILEEIFLYKNSDDEGIAEFDMEGTIRAFGKVVSILGDYIATWYLDPRCIKGTEDAFQETKSAVLA